MIMLLVGERLCISGNFLEMARKKAYTALVHKNRNYAQEYLRACKGKNREKLVHREVMNSAQCLCV